MIVTYILRHLNPAQVVAPSDQIQYALRVAEAHSVISLNLRFLARLMELATPEQQIETQIRMYADHIAITGPEEYLSGHPYLEEPADDLFGLWGSNEDGDTDLQVLERLIRAGVAPEDGTADWTYDEEEAVIRPPTSTDRTFVTADYLDRVRSRARGPRRDGT